jgi:hypothetical protein
MRAYGSMRGWRSASTGARSQNSRRQVSQGRRVLDAVLRALVR